MSNTFHLKIANVARMQGRVCDDDLGTFHSRAYAQALIDASHDARDEGRPAPYVERIVFTLSGAIAFAIGMIIAHAF